MTIEDFKKQLDEGIEQLHRELDRIDQEEAMLTKDIILVLENGEKLRQECQVRFQQYVIDKSISLEERFHVWSEFCDKVTHRYNSMFIHELIVARFYIMQSRIYSIDWEAILKYYKDRKSYIKISRETLMELMIEHNFGELTCS